MKKLKGRKFKTTSLLSGKEITMLITGVKKGVVEFKSELGTDILLKRELDRLIAENEWVEINENY